MRIGERLFEGVIIGRIIRIRRIPGDIGWDIVAVVMNAEAVRVVLNTRFNRLIEPDQVIHHRKLVVQTGRGQRATDHDHRRINRPDRPHLRLAGIAHTGRVSPFRRLPLAVQILLIPHFNRVNPTRIPFQQCAQEVVILVVIIRRAVNVAHSTGKCLGM